MRSIRDCHWAQEPKNGLYACGAPVTARSTTSEHREKVDCGRCKRSGQTHLERFLKKVDKNGPMIVDTPCWAWKGAKVPSGYGSTWDGKKRLGAHRFSYILHHGMPAPGMVVCHRCDNPNCVNPAHFFLGTNSDNLADARAKGRLGGRRCKKIEGAELDAVRLRLRSGETQLHVAQTTGISLRSIERISSEQNRLKGSRVNE